MKNTQHFQNYKIIYHLLFFSLLNFAYIPNISANEVNKCNQNHEINASELEIPSPQLREINTKIKNVALSFKIPSNYRTLLVENTIEILSPSIYNIVYCAYRNKSNDEYGVFLENPYLGLFITLKSRKKYLQELNDQREYGILVSSNTFKLNNYIVEKNITTSMDGFGCFVDYGIMKNTTTDNIMMIRHSYSFRSNKTEKDCSNITEKHKILNQIFNTLVNTLNF
ncbi:hypothetical protein WEU38_08425 [Cyanobacterium aponinum AL20118]|uniref:Uncharacterized protein n=1 Tax=Cyanobacterium aponinum AL20115 TaxID=3090662 RepID=A0AAF0ZFY7_9CHRO|nr:hypothetical protein [Cyanobacterium aponinum]WPF90284.1 hypothetical protein SAY89_08445 [Cyanobacterium aponinum AL20115]